MKKKIIPIITGFLLIMLVAAASAEAKNIFKIGGDVTVEADQQVDTVIDIGGQITVNGLVEHNVIAVGGSVVLSNDAVVRGDVVCAGGVIVKGSNAQVFGDITEINSANISTAFSSALRGELEGWSLIVNIISLCFFAVIFIIALLLTIFIPRPLIGVAKEIQSYKVKSFFWGFAATLMIVPFFMLLVLSLIGITLIPLVFTILLLAFILGYVAAGSLIGNWIITKIFHSQKKRLTGETIVGLILLWLISWVPYVGWLVKIFALTFGLGGVLLALFNRRWQSAAPSPPVNEEQTKMTFD
ncbi:MAG: hypothetical protein AB2L12_08015 [Smithellaceae bacterium]